MRTLLIFGLGLILACSRPATKNSLQKVGPNNPGAIPQAEITDGVMEIIDAHIHTFFNDEPEGSSGIIYSKKQLLIEMAENNIVGAITMGHNFSEPQEDLSANNIFECAGLRAEIDYQLLEQGLRSKRYHCVKVYLGYVHKYANDPVYRKAYRLALKYKVPVVFHTGDTYSTKAKLKYADPLTIDDVAVDFPELTIVIAHMGNPWVHSAAEVAYKNPNVYLEGSAFFAGPIQNYSEETIQKFMVEPIKWAYDYVEKPEKILFGTDWPLVPMKYYLQAFKKAIPKKSWNLVFFENAKRVYNLELNRQTKVAVGNSKTRSF